MSCLLAASPETITTWRWEQAPPAWQVFLIVALVAAFAAATYLLEPRDERRGAWKVPLAILRTIIILLGIAILFRPLESREQREVKTGQVVVAVDTSRSMGFLDREKNEDERRALADAIHVTPERLRELSRLDRIKVALRVDGGSFLRKLAEKNQVRLFTFDSTRTRLADVPKLESGTTAPDPNAPATPDPVSDALARLEATSADGQSTALGDSLQRILTDLRSERVAGLVLLTDGRSNSGSLSAEAVAARFGRKGVKVYAVGVGDPDPPRDLALDDFRAPDVSLAGDILSGAVLVRAQGYPEPRDVHVRFKLDDQVVHEETIRIGGTGPNDRTERDVPFTTKVARAGEYTLEAQVDPDPDELTADNNRTIRRVRVIDERIKVLYVEGYPRWEYRYLKNALIRDKNMQVQVLLLSADPDYHQEHSEGVPPLSRLPSPEQLLEYHVIILGDVNPEARSRTNEPVFSAAQIKAMADLVKDRAGGMLMISGEQHAPRSWVGTPIADVLPIEIDTSGARTTDSTRPWRMRLTQEGYDSPLLRLETGEEESRDLWENRLPDLYWYMPVERAKPQARVLAMHPRDKNQHGPYPLIAWHRYGSGTCMWLGFDEAWRWRQSVGDKYQYRFYGQIIRFLSLQSFTRTKRFFVTTDKTAYDVGEDVKITAEIRDRDGGPERPSQDVIIDLPDGTNQTVNLAPAGQGEPGKFKGTWKPVLVGPYRVHIDPGQSGSLTEVASRVFEVKLPRLELQEPRMDKEGLERIANASSGKFLSLAQLQTVVDEIEPIVEPQRVGRSETELWDQPWVFGLFFGLLLVEWIGRKMTRLL
jgi:hypothetical protein